jgi:N-acetylglucosamine repressor
MLPTPSKTRRKVDRRLTQRFHRALVLNLIRTDPTLTRATIARQTRLSPAAVSGIVDSLLQAGLVREGPAESTGAVGRRPLRLSFNPTARLALGIAVNIPEVSVALVDLGGTMRAVHADSVPRGATPEEVLDMAARLARRALRAAYETPVIGVGLAIPGMVRWPEGINLFSPNFGWRDVPVRALMEHRMHRTVLVDNEMRALALAEHHFGAARDAQTAVFIEAGYGVGGAVILNGEVYRGVHGAAGEVGHNTVEPDGPLCGCGNRGCLEVYASSNGLVARAREALAAGRPSTLRAIPADSLALEHIVAAAGAGDPLAGELMERAARYLGLAVANSVDNWDPELVVLSGSVIQVMGSYFDRLLMAEQQSVLETARGRVPVLRASLHAPPKIVGAATLAIADYLAAPLESETTIAL